MILFAFLFIFFSFLYPIPYPDIFRGKLAYTLTTILAHSETAIIQMTENGFESQTITVDENSAVLFINRDKVDRWPASNIHPTHDIYPEFDPQKPIEVGDSWVFKPKKAGVWKYHDHLLPHIRGSLTVTKENSGKEEVNTIENIKNFVSKLLNSVKNFFAQINFVPKSKTEDPNVYIRGQVKKCYEKDGADGCYKDVARTLYNQFGLSQTLKLLKDNENHQEVYARCHEVTHYLSRFEYEKLGSISKVYASCDSTCHGGCYHGTLEAYLKEQTEKSGFDLSGSFSTICGKAQDYQKPLEFNECLHGMGHAAMFVTDMELKDSLALCDTISDQANKERCFTGAFMENSSSSTSFDHRSKYIKADDPFYPCNSLEEKYQPLCWQYQSSYFSIISNQDWRKVADLCLQIPLQYQERCIRTIGTNQVGFTRSLPKMKEDCDVMPISVFEDICVAGVVASMAYRFVGNMQIMIDFCAIVDSDHRESCFRQIGAGIIDWDKNREAARGECQKIPDPQGANWCMSVI